MKDKLLKVITTVTTMMLTIISGSMVFAANPDMDPSKWTGSSNASVSGLTNFGQSLISIISTIGSIASVIVLIILGIKYMMGSAEEKAEYKKTLLPYVIGAILVFAASTIASVIFGVATSNWTA